MTVDHSQQTRSRRGLWLMLGLFALVLVCLGALAASTGWDEMLAQLGRLGPLQISILLGLSLVNYGLRALRWRLFTQTLGIPTRLTQDLRHYIGAFAMVVTPARLGELVRMRWIARETGWSFDRTAPMALTDRASDLAAMGLLLALCLLVSPPVTGLGWAFPVAAVVLALAILITRPALMIRCGTWAYQITGLLPRFFARVRRAGRSLSFFSNGLCLSLTTVLGMAAWLAEAYAFHLLLMWLGADIGLTSAAAIFLFATLAGGLTGAPGGIGGAELAMVALLQLEGVPPETSVPATAVIRATTLWFAIVIGLAAFPLAERYSTPEPRPT